MSRFTDLFQPKPEPKAPVSAPVFTENKVVPESEKVVEIGKWKSNKTK